jgi:hypothetical protein
MVALEVEWDVDPDGATQTTSWIDAAQRANAVLTQSLPDELLDELSDGHWAHGFPFRLRPVLAG